MNKKDAFRTLRFKTTKNKENQLFTEWGEKLNPEEVLMEYPRPQLRRENYRILNGYWNYSITKEEKMPVSYEGLILVPFSPESILSGVKRQLKPGEYLWYERTIFIDEIDHSKRCILHFGAVDQYCEVFINNKKVTDHMGGYLPFSIDITNHLRIQDNTITVKVLDYSDTSYHSCGKQRLKRGGMFYTAQSGIWQTVWMEWVPIRYIDYIKITPLLDQSSVQIYVHMTEQNQDYLQTDIMYQIAVLENGQVINSMNSSHSTLTVPIPDCKTWSPENPFLYDLVITADQDRVESYFAMRKFEVKKDSMGIQRIYLNHQPYYQNGILDQGYWPDGLYTAPSDEAMIFDIKKAKELGYNMIRKHIKIEPLRWYYHCDRIGLLVWQDIVNGGETYNMVFLGYIPTFFVKFQQMVKDSWYDLFSRKNEKGRREWIAECRNTVKHLYNCPCIAVWVPFNEGWGQFDAEKAVIMIRHLDNTRLIDHASGWYDQKCGDFKSIHNYFHKLEVIKDKRAFVISEFGGYACLIPKHTYSGMIYGYRIYLTDKELNTAYQKLFQKEISDLIKKGLCASVYTQLTDVEDEINGLLTYDRKVCKVEKLGKLF